MDSRPLTPWSPLAHLTEQRNAAIRERDDARRECETLRRQVDGLFALGVLIHKAADRAVREERAASVAYLCREAATAHADAQRTDNPPSQRDRASSQADVLATAADAIERGEHRS